MSGDTYRETYRSDYTPAVVGAPTTVRLVDQETGLVARAEHGLRSRAYAEARAELDRLVAARKPEPDA